MRAIRRQEEVGLLVVGVGHGIEIVAGRGRERLMETCSLAESVAESEKSFKGDEMYLETQSRVEEEDGQGYTRNNTAVCFCFSWKPPGVRVQAKSGSR